MSHRPPVASLSRLSISYWISYVVPKSVPAFNAAELFFRCRSSEPCVVEINSHSTALFFLEAGPGAVESVERLLLLFEPLTTLKHIPALAIIVFIYSP